jgi:hypothetical protein
VDSSSEWETDSDDEEYHMPHVEEHVDPVRPTAPPSQASGETGLVPVLRGTGTLAGVVAANASAGLHNRVALSVRTGGYREEEEIERAIIESMRTKMEADARQEVLVARKQMNKEAELWLDEVSDLRANCKGVIQKGKTSLDTASASTTEKDVIVLSDDESD